VTAVASKRAEIGAAALGMLLPGVGWMTLNTGPERRLRWGLLIIGLLLLAGAVSTWRWYAARPRPAPSGATLVLAGGECAWRPRSV